MKRIKRLFSYVLLLLCSSVLISCDVKKDTLDCTIDKSTKEGIVTKMNTLVEYANDKVEKVTFTYSIEYDSTKYNSDDINVLVDNVINEYKKIYDGDKHIKITSSNEVNNKHDIKVAIEYNKLTIEEREEYGLSFPDGKEKSKDDFTSEGYTCK